MQAFMVFSCIGNSGHFGRREPLEKRPLHTSEALKAASTGTAYRWAAYTVQLTPPFYT